MSRDGAQKRVRTAENSAALIRLVASGLTVAEAAKQLGVSQASGYRLYTDELARIGRENTALKQDLLGRELETLRLAQRALMPKVLEGSPQHINSLIKLMDRRAAYLGLNAAQRVDVTVEKVDDAMRAITNILDGRAAANVQPIRRVLAERTDKPTGEDTA